MDGAGEEAELRCGSMLVTSTERPDLHGLLLVSVWYPNPQRGGASLNVWQDSYIDKDGMWGGPEDVMEKSPYLGHGFRFVDGGDVGEALKLARRGLAGQVLCAGPPGWGGHHERQLPRTVEF